MYNHVAGFEIQYLEMFPHQKKLNFHLTRTDSIIKELSEYTSRSKNNNQIVLKNNVVIEKHIPKKLKYDYISLISEIREIYFPNILLHCNL